MDLNTSRLMAGYRIWADDLTYGSVAALPSGEANKARRTLFGSIIGTLNHNLVVDRIWQAHGSDDARGDASARRHSRHVSPRLDCREVF